MTGPIERVRILKCDHQQVQSGTIGTVVSFRTFQAGVHKGGVNVEIEQVWEDAWRRRYKGKETVFVEDGDYEEVK